MITLAVPICLSLSLSLPVYLCLCLSVSLSVCAFCCLRLSLSLFGGAKGESSAPVSYRVSSTVGPEA